MYHMQTDARNIYNDMLTILMQKFVGLRQAFLKVKVLVGIRDGTGGGLCRLWPSNPRKIDFS